MTGGLKQFDYRVNAPRVSPTEKEEIELAYEKYYDRRENERKRKRNLWWIIALIVLVILIGIYFYTKG